MKNVFDLTRDIKCRHTVMGGCYYLCQQLSVQHQLLQGSVPALLNQLGMGRIKAPGTLNFSNKRFQLTEHLIN